MIIYCSFKSNFHHSNINNNDKFSVDLDPSDDVDKLKTVISMQY